MTAHSPYADISRQMKASGRMILPPAVEDLGYIAAMIAGRIAQRESETHSRVYFGDAGAMEAAHKLGRWVHTLPAAKKAAIEQWLGCPSSSGQ